MALEYHYFPNSHWSRVVSLLLAEKGLDPIRHFVDIRENANFEPDYFRLNPRGVVPTLVDGETVVCDSMNIATHLDEIAAPGLYQRHANPQRVAEWAKELEDFPLMLFSYSVWVLGRRGEKSAAILDDKVARAVDYAKRHPELADQYLRKRDFFIDFRSQVHDETHVAKESRRWRACLDRLAAEVDDDPWLGGDTYSFADALATSILFRLVDLERMHEWNEDANHPLRRYFDRLRDRASFRAVWEDDPLIPR